MLGGEGGKYFMNIGGSKVLLLINEQSIPRDESLEKLKYIAENFNLGGTFVALPDLHFKDKNFVPSGMVIPLKNAISPLLLGPNNDGIGAFKVRLKSKSGFSDSLDVIFNGIKEKIALFRRPQPIIDRDELMDIFMNGITHICHKWDFPVETLDVFEDGGVSASFQNENYILSLFPQQRPENLPDFIPNYNPIEAGQTNLGVLDGTSHFIDLFEVSDIRNEQVAHQLDLKTGDLFFMVHAGSADIGLILHRFALSQGERQFALDTEAGKKILDAFHVAANFGFANRLYIYKTIREVVKKTWKHPLVAEVFSDIPHDYVEIDGARVLHRKGGAKLIPANAFSSESRYTGTGLPYTFPSAPGGDAFIIHNAEGSKISYNCISHGAGRMIRKEEAVEKYKDLDFQTSLQHKIRLYRYGFDKIEGQNPLAFKDLHSVMSIFERHRLCQVVAKLKPIASLKS